MQYQKTPTIDRNDLFNHLIQQVHGFTGNAEIRKLTLVKLNRTFSLLVLYHAAAAVIDFISYEMQSRIFTQNGNGSHIKPPNLSLRVGILFYYYITNKPKSSRICCPSNQYRGHEIVSYKPRSVFRLTNCWNGLVEICNACQIRFCCMNDSGQDSLPGVHHK